MDRWPFLGSILILLGVLVWPAYALTGLQTAEEVPVAPFLAAHLSLVIPGALLGGRGIIRRLISRLGKQ